MKSAYAIETPLGTMHAVEESGRVVRLLLPGEPPPAPEGIPQTELARELAEYFAGKRKAFGVPVAHSGPSFFQAVRDAALAIPYGRTVSYAQLAVMAGRPKAFRAVGQALAANPLPILIPCHRVVYSIWKKHSYRGGAEMKAFLLDLEKNNA
jgi:methylated-DNA-[protein]-cysteine S-methyltransferase